MAIAKWINQPTGIKSQMSCLAQVEQLDVFCALLGHDAQSDLQDMMHGSDLQDMMRIS